MPDPQILKVLFSVQRLHDGVPSGLAFPGYGFILLDRLRLRLRLLPHLQYSATHMLLASSGRQTPPQIF
jgi:hypothetical protein